MKRRHETPRKVVESEAREEGLYAARRADPTRQDAHPIVGALVPSPPQWAAWRVEYWNAQVSNWGHWDFARDLAQRARISAEIRALGHRVRFVELRTRRPPGTHAPQPPSPERQAKFMRFGLVVREETRQGRLLLPRNPWIPELGVALSRLLGHATGRARRDWESRSFEEALRRQERVAALIEEAVRRSQYPQLTTERWAFIERMS